MVVELDRPADIAELMFALTWFAGTPAELTPLMDPAVYDQAIKKAKKLASPP